VTDLLLAVVILLLLGVLAFLAVLAKRRSGADPRVEADLRAQVAGLQAQAGERLDQVGGLQARQRELQERLAQEYGARKAAEAALEAERRNLAEQRTLLDQAQVKLKEAFAASPPRP